MHTHANVIESITMAALLVLAGCQSGGMSSPNGSGPAPALSAESAPGSAENAPHQAEAPAPRITWPSLHRAVAAGDATLIKALLRDGKSVDQAEPTTGVTALHLAVKSNKLELVELLLDNNADPNVKAKPGRATPLHIAIDTKSIEIVRILLEDPRTDVTAELRSGHTPLDVSLLIGDPDTVTALLDHRLIGGSRSPEDLLHRAAAGGHEELVERLLDQGAAVDARRASDEATPLLAASATRKIEVARLLLSKKADVNAVNNRGLSSLHAAAAAADKPLTEVLLDHGAAVNARDAAGFTPLHMAAMSGATDVTELLLSRGARMVTENEAGLTPADLAREYGYRKLAAKLSAEAPNQQ